MRDNVHEYGIAEKRQRSKKIFDTTPFRCDIHLMANDFYSGRNGSDALSVFLAAVAAILAVAASVASSPAVRMSLSALAIVLVGIAILRMLSRNIGRRRHENDVFLSLFSFMSSDPARKRQKEDARRKAQQRREDMKTHAYFRCPECKTECRVPKGKGKIRITCPKCGHQFIKRT